jgi:phage host-nuclease inhibitor protein Gam
MSEYESAIIEIAALLGFKSEELKDLQIENKKLEEENNRLIDDLEKARNYIEVLKNDLKELSKEFTAWKSQKEKDELKQS